MIDRVTATARLAHRHAHVTHLPAPGWAIEILTGLVVILAIALLAVLGQLALAVTEKREALEEGAFWSELALIPDTRPMVRLDSNGDGFHCAHFNIQREWELAVAAECEVLAGLLQMARPSP